MGVHNSEPEDQVVLKGQVQSEGDADLERRTIELLRKSQSLEIRYRETGEISALEEKIALDRQILSDHIPSHPGYGILCEALVDGLKAYFEVKEHLESLREAIDLGRQLLSMYPSGHPDRARTCTNLAVSLDQYYEHVGGINLIDEAIALQREAIQLRPPDHIYRSICCSNLATSLMARYKLLGQRDHLNEAISLETEALALRAPGHPHRSVSCFNLAVLLTDMYSCDGNVSLLGEALVLQREAMSLRHPHSAKDLGELGTILQEQYMCINDVAILEEAIDLQRKSLSLCPVGHKEHELRCANLLSSLVLYYQHTGDTGPLDESISLGHELLSLCSPEHPKWIYCCKRLANSLTARYRQLGDIYVLDGTISLRREMLRLQPTGHIDRASACEGLGVQLGLRYEKLHTTDDLDEAIALQQEVLALRPTGDPARALSCSNLTCLLGLKYNYTGDVRTLLEAISIQRESYSLSKQDRDRAVTAGNLANIIIVYYLHQDAKGVADLFEAQFLLAEACHLSPPQSVWRHSCMLAYTYILQGNTLSHIHEASRSLETSLACQPDNPIDAVIRVLDYLTPLFQALRNSVEVSEHLLLTPIYQRMIELLPLLINPALAKETQLQNLLRCKQLGSEALVNAVLVNNIPAGLEAIEVAQCVFWSQRVYRRDPQLLCVPEKFQLELENLLRALSTASSLPAYATSLSKADPIAQDLVYTQSNRLYTLIREIRSIPGLERFMLGEMYETLSALATAFHPIVVLAGTAGHFYALVFMSTNSGGNATVELDVEQEDLEGTIPKHGLHRGAARSNQVEEVHQDRGLKHGKPKSKLDTHLRYIWLKIVAPVMEILGYNVTNQQEKPRLHWCPTGIFSAIPLHAAGIYDGRKNERRCCADYVVSSYCPTMTTLLQTRRALTPLSRDNLALMLLAEKRAYDKKLVTIPGVDHEIGKILPIANSSQVSVVHRQTDSTTVAESATAMKTANIVHIACHGIQESSDATESGFCLGDGRLTISHLMELHLKDGFLAFLSACETATGNKEQPDQAMHLAAAMLFTGFKNVVASMWAISDEDGPRVAEWFYGELFAHETIDANVVARALDVAVCKLRASGVSSDRWAPFIHLGA